MGRPPEQLSNTCKAKQAVTSDKLNETPDPDPFLFLYLTTGDTALGLGTSQAVVTTTCETALTGSSAYIKNEVVVTESISCPLFIYFYTM